LEVVVGDHLDAVDDVEVGAGGDEAGDDGVFPGVFGGADEDGAGGAVELAFEGAAGDVGGEA
jgi:hypothetical protein